MLFFPDCSDVIRGAPRLVTGAPRLAASAPRCFQACGWRSLACLRRSEWFPNLSQSIEWYSWSSNQRSQWLWRPARMPSYRLILSWNWRIQVNTPHPLSHSWRLPVTKIHFADVPNEPIPTYSHSWLPQCSITIGYQQSEQKWWNCDRRAICNVTRHMGPRSGVICHRGVSDASNGARPLWPSHPGLTEMFFADGWLVAGDSWCTVVYCGLNNGVCWYQSLSQIFSAPIATRLHNSSRLWCWQLQLYACKQRRIIGY